MSWITEKVLEFIKEIENREILWKKDHKNYHNMVKKEDAWREISNIFDMSITELKKKWDNLKGSRRREKAEMTKSVDAEKG